MVFDWRVERTSGAAVEEEVSWSDKTEICESIISQHKPFKPRVPSTDSQLILAINRQLLTWDVARDMTVVTSRARAAVAQEEEFPAWAESSKGDIICFRRSTSFRDAFGTSKTVLQRLHRAMPSAGPGESRKRNHIIIRTTLNCIEAQVIMRIKYQIKLHGSSIVPMTSPPYPAPCFFWAPESFSPVLQTVLTVEEKSAWSPRMNCSVALWMLLDAGVPVSKFSATCVGTLVKLKLIQI